MGAKIEDHGWDVTQYMVIKNKALLVQPDRYRQLLDAEKGLAERDKLIEQMKTAMEAALKNLKMQGGSRTVIEDIETALSAAERATK